VIGITHNIKVGGHFGGGIFITTGMSDLILIRIGLLTFVTQMKLK
jgi:hypothetical protein